MRLRSREMRERRTRASIDGLRLPVRVGEIPELGLLQRLVLDDEGIVAAIFVDQVRHDDLDGVLKRST